MKVYIVIAYSIHENNCHILSVFSNKKNAYDFIKTISSDDYFGAMVDENEVIE